RKSPALAFTAIAVLALGIGVNVAAFNIVDVMSFKPLHVRDPQSLVRFTTQSPTLSYHAVSYPALMFYRESGTTFSAMLAQTKTQMTLGDNPGEGVETGLVTANYFSELGASPAYGRLFDPASDALPAAPAVAVLGYGFWQSRFGADPSVVGRTIRLNQRPVTVIGVTAFNFTGLDPEAGEKNGVWLLLDKQTYFVPDTKLLTSFDVSESGVQAFGRLKPGITRRAAQEALLPLAQELERQHPGVLSKGEHLVVHPGGISEEINGNDLPEYGFLAALVLLVLAAACGNLGNLLLGRAVAREREISIRMAVGAGRGRIIRQLMTENILLALLGSGAGLLLGWFMSRAVAVALGGPRNMDFSPDWRTVLFALGIGMLACVLFGLPAARQASNTTRRPGRTRTIFMAAQVAASCVLIVVSALLVRSLYHAYNTDPGFDYVHVITIDPQLYAHGYSPEKAAQYTRDLSSRLEQLPGVQSVAAVWVVPLGNHVSMRPAGGDIKVNIHHNNISPRLFETLAIPLLRGRDFTRNDKDVAIVTDSCAR
ncbi:MAG TPA: ABC transporter permease, partial [Alphaproteobacteria bacterium]|nr:ABC transporter permease [Alphaproteobacteria bacterium]